MNAIRNSTGFAIAEALDAADIQACHALFVEYYDSLGVSLAFPGFAGELANLPGEYARPAGRLLLARVLGEPAGCVALRRLEPGVAEMKRLYVQPRHRGMGLGRLLAECVIDEARAIGYRAMKLDTLPQLATAQSLYADLGFVPAERYNTNPAEGVRFYALDLTREGPR